MPVNHPVVSKAEWIRARQTLLAQEKAFTRARDALNQARRDLPWELVEKAYPFDGPTGTQTLSDLFDGRSQLIVYHAMFDPDTPSECWTRDAACYGCSFWADHFDGMTAHLNQRDVTLVAISRAPVEKLVKYKQRMGWRFTWVSSGNCDFNYDYGVSFRADEIAEQRGFYNYIYQDPGTSEREGVSVFAKDDAARIYHTYSTYARGIDLLNTTYNYLDLVPQGRDERGRGPYWVRRHDEYGAACCHDPNAP